MANAVDRQQFTESIALYQRAAGGPDAGLTAIALYKTGWAHYDENRYTDAAEAFRAVLDLESSQPNATAADLLDEAEAYLVHSLAGAGGARAFAQHFDRAGARPYESRVLLAMGKNSAASACMRTRPPSTSCFHRALPAASGRAAERAQRLIESRRKATPGRRSPRPASRRRHALLQRAIVSGAGSSSVRAAGEAFARVSWTTAARAHQQAAQKQHRTRNELAIALDTYQHLIQQWPNDPRAGARTLGGTRPQRRSATTGSRWSTTRRGDGEGRASRASLSGSASRRGAWYASTRGGAFGRPRAVHSPASAATRSRAWCSMRRDALVARFRIIRRRGAAVRQVTLSFAHGWHDRAARDFGLLATRHPNDRHAVRAATLRADALYRTAIGGRGSRVRGSARAREGRGRSIRLAKRAAQSIPICHPRRGSRGRRGFHEARAARRAFGRSQPAGRTTSTRTSRSNRGRARVLRGEAHRGRRALDGARDRHFRAVLREGRASPDLQAWKQANRPTPPRSYAKFAARFRDYESAKDAWIEAADLFAAAGMPERADQQRLAYLAHSGRRGDRDGDPRAARARDLATVDTERPLATLLQRPRLQEDGCREGTGVASRGVSEARAGEFEARVGVADRAGAILRAEESYASYGALSWSSRSRSRSPRSTRSSIRRSRSTAAAWISARASVVRTRSRIAWARCSRASGTRWSAASVLPISREDDLWRTKSAARKGPALPRPAPRASGGTCSSTVPDAARTPGSTGEARCGSVSDPSSTSPRPIPARHRSHARIGATTPDSAQDPVARERREMRGRRTMNGSGIRARLRVSARPRARDAGAARGGARRRVLAGVGATRARPDPSVDRQIARDVGERRRRVARERKRASRARRQEERALPASVGRDETRERSMRAALSRWRSWRAMKRAHGSSASPPSPTGRIASDSCSWRATRSSSPRTCSMPRSRATARTPASRCSRSCCSTTPSR